VNRSLAAFAALALIAALAVAGCGSSSNNSSGSTTASSGGPYGGGSETEASTKTASSTATTGAPITVGTASGVGKVLVDSEGMTLYYFEKDQNGESACYGPCEAGWPPLTTEGKPQAGEGAMASKLGTTERKDGTTQVTYAGWPLYTFVEDKKPGEDNGTDSKAFGASWYPLHPNGQKAGH
jgi:predicted lipoprotein with Yx(FWY)xxD motif